MRSCDAVNFLLPCYIALLYSENYGSSEKLNFCEFGKLNVIYHIIKS